MANSQNISKFYTTATSRDFARQFQFRIASWSVAGVALIDTDLVYLETATLPGRTINNIAVPFMGLQFNVPGTASYPGSDAWTVSFRCPADYSLRQVLEETSEDTFSIENSTGAYSIKDSNSTIQLELLDKEMNAKRTYKLVGAYVTNIGDISYNLGDNGTVQLVPATIAYQYWTSADVKASTK